MKKTKILLVLIVCLAAMLLAGCGKEKAPGEDQVPQQPGDQKPDQDAGMGTTPGDTGKLAALLGKTDADVVAQLGEGTPTAGDDGIVTARDYTQPLYQKEVLFSVGYEGGKVSAIVVMPSEGDFDAWGQLVAQELGKPEKSGTDDSEGGDTKEQMWQLEGGIIVSLKQAFGAVSLEIFMEQ